MNSSKPTWQAIAAEAQRHRDSTLSDPIIQPPIPSIPTSLPHDVSRIPHQLLTPSELQITSSTPETLLPLLASGTLSAHTVTLAFLRRAGIAQQLTNCLTELLPQRALARARELDTYLSIHGKPIGPLHGLPISVKEHVQFKDLGINFAYVSHYHDKGTHDAHPLRILHAAGAIFYARTTEPQAIMHLECSSNLYGVTVNPFNTRLSSGGSSGGEGALVGLRGSCLGIGTDIGGSIRSPAGNCGVYGLRPTAGRLPYEGVEAMNGMSGGVLTVQGPLSTSLAGIKLYVKTMVEARPWEEDGALVPLPWREMEVRRGQRLRVGVMWDDGIVQPHPPIKRALREVVEKLRRVEGVEVFDFTAYKHDLGWEIISSLYFPDGGKNEHDEYAASGEPYRPLTEWIIKEEGHVKRLEMENLWHWQSQRDQYQAAYHKHWLATKQSPDDQPMDVLLCPYFPSASSRLDTAKYWAYTSTWNLVDYPALIFPVSKVDPSVDKVDGDFKPYGEKDTWNHELYDPEFFSGAPVSLQLVGQRYQEEKVIAAGEYIVEQLQLPWAKFT